MVAGVFICAPSDVRTRIVEDSAGRTSVRAAIEVSSMSGLGATNARTTLAAAVAPTTAATRMIRAIHNAQKHAASICDVCLVQIRLFGNQNQQPVRMLFQWRNATPVGLAATLPVSCQRCSHFTAELALTSMHS